MFIYLIAFITSMEEKPKAVERISSVRALTFTTLWANSADGILKYFSYFSQKIVFDNLYKISKPVFRKCRMSFTEILNQHAKH